MTVLAWKGVGDPLRNLFTLVRHRRQDALGPWAKEPESKWSVDELTEELRLFSFDGPLERCEPWVEGILNSGTLEIEGLEILYALNAEPRRHWAFRDRRVPHKESLVSPFVRHSAEILEYWSFAAEPTGEWREALASLSPKVRARFSRLGFPLDRRSDRVGNLMIARAEDAITCDLVAHHNGTLSLVVDVDEESAEIYRATVWASHSGDEVLRREVGIKQSDATIAFESDVDRVGFAIWRVADGQCVDFMDEYLIMEVPIRLNFEAGPTLRLRDRRRQVSYEVNASRYVSEFSVRVDQGSAELDKGIRRRWLDHRLRERESVVQRSGDLVRFEPGKWNEAVQHFLGILGADCDQRNPVYLADRYFMSLPDEPREIQLYLDMFAATTGAPFRILCGKEGKGSLPRWWSSSLSQITSHVSVRRFLRDNQRRDSAFHDRYLITPKREILITHSITGWESGGVTFASLPYGVYRAEAEQLWGITLGSAKTPTLAEEIT